jgi:hypothetical protein
MYKKNIVPSLCIPRVEENITLKIITSTINKISIGTIDHIDIIPIKNNNGSHKRVFIHFKRWFTDERSTQIYNKLKCGDIIKVFYDDPWFWKISLNKSQCSR